MMGRLQNLLLFMPLFLGHTSLAGEPVLKVPDGFAVSRVAGTPEVIFPMFATLGDDGALFVAESSGLDLYEELQKLTRRCRVSRLEDRNRDGVFERAQVFADQLVFPMGLVWRGGKLYVADPPEVVVLEDTDADGRADKRTVLLSGFGHNDNGSLHGLTFGPDGWLYMTIGQPDGYHLKRPDGTVLSGKSGALLRCRADGSDVEVVCRGFENLVEVEFLSTGEIIGTDNWFSLPQVGERDALVHLVEGGLYPLQLQDKGTRFLVSGDPLPPLAMYPAVALSGIARYRGDAFPAHLRDCLFTAQFNARRIVAHRLERSGSTFRSTDAGFLTTDDPDFHPSDVLEDSDGSLLIVDTGSWYVHHCPTGRIRKVPAQGGIYRVQFNRERVVAQPGRGERAEASKAEVDQIRSLTATDPDVAARAARAIARTGNKTVERALMNLLARPEPHVRMAAAEALAHCGSTNAVPVLFAALTSDPDRFLEHALTHAIYRLADASALSVALEHPHPRVQKAALTLLDQTHPQLISSAAVFERLSVKDEALRHAARRILQRHSDWAERAVPLVHDLIFKPVLSVSEADALRELILAFQASDVLQRLVATSITNASLPAVRREALVEALSQTTLSPFPRTWISALALVLGGSEEPVRFQAARTAATRKVTALNGALIDLIDQTNLAPGLRLEALRATLGRRPKLTARAFDLLLAEISPRSGPAARLAATELLGRARWHDPVNDPVRLAGVVRGDQLIIPSTLLPLLLQSEGNGFTGPAWSCITEAIRLGWQPTEKELELIRARVAPVGDKLIQELTDLITQRATNQSAQIDAYAELLTGGDPIRGQKWFVEKVACAACHRVGTQGGLVGPDLTRIGAIRAGRDLIESIVLPGIAFAQGYDTFRVTLRDNEELTGIRVRQPDESFALRTASGAEVRLLPDQLKSVERMTVSVMPEGLLGALSRDEIRDLFAYLQSLK